MACGICKGKKTQQLKSNNVSSITDDCKVARTLVRQIVKKLNRLYSIEQDKVLKQQYEKSIKEYNRHMLNGLYCPISEIEDLKTIKEHVTEQLHKYGLY